MLPVWRRQTKLPGELSTRSWTGLVLPLDVLPCGLSWNLTFLSRSLTTIACGFGLAYHMPAACRSLSKVEITFELTSVQDNDFPSRSRSKEEHEAKLDG